MAGSTLYRYTSRVAGVKIEKRPVLTKISFSVSTVSVILHEL